MLLTNMEEKLVIRKIKDLLYSWWNVEAIFIDADGKMVSNIDNLKNPVWKDLLHEQSPVYQDVVKLALASANQQHISEKNHQVRQLGQVKVNCVTCVLRVNSRPTGTWVFLGFLSEDQNIESAKASLEELNLSSDSKKFIKESPQFVSKISQDEMLKFLELCQEIPAECIKIYNTTYANNETSEDELVQRYKEKHGIIGSSEAMRNVFYLLDKVSQFQTPVLIKGESGTGKELIAKSIHNESKRKDQPFICRNVSAINDNLIESEIFGHVKGAFTGASASKKGLFELAHKGTLFLDEIGDISQDLQVKLLRVLQEGVFYPVGSTQPVTVDVRIVAATNRDLKSMIEEGTFREDLFYRLNVINIDLPSLKERREDIPFLAAAFLKPSEQNNFKAYMLSEASLELLKNFHWPGNIRQFQNEMSRLCVLGKPQTPLKPSLLSPEILNNTSDGTSSEATSKVTHEDGKINLKLPLDVKLKAGLEALERQIIHSNLLKHGHNKSQLAKRLGVSRSKLIQKIEQYNLENKDIFNKKAG